LRKRAEKELDVYSNSASPRRITCAISDKKSSNPMLCRPTCAACCIAPSISSPIPGMPHGKPAGVPCIQLDAKLGCKIFGLPDRPAVCASLAPSREMCGESREFAMVYLQRLEALSAPNS
jgi:uncharacterized protein